MARSLLLTKAGQVMEMATMLKEGKHAHPGAVDPHDLRVQHIGTDNDMDDPLHKEESKAYAAAKKAEQAVRDAIAQLRSGRRQIMASPQNHQKAMMAVQEARANYADAQSQLETVSNRRVQQLQHLVETLGLSGPEAEQAEQVEQGGEQLDQDWQTGQMNQASYGGRATPAESAHFQSLIAPPKAPKPAATGARTRRPAATSSPKPATPPSAPSAGQTPAATQRRNTRSITPKKPPTAMDPAKRIGEAGKQAIGGVAGHYMDTLASTPYDRAMVTKHGDHGEGYFDDARKDEPKVDAGLMTKHDTPNSPHSEHATASGGDPDELTQRRQRVRPEQAEPPEQLEHENRRRAQRGFPQDEPPGPRPITPYAAAQKLALDAEHTRARLMPRIYNNRGMNEGMEDEDAKLDNHEDSEGSTAHHQGGRTTEGGPGQVTQEQIDNRAKRMAQYEEMGRKYPNHELRPFWRKQIQDFHTEAGDDADNGPAMKRAFQEARHAMNKKRVASWGRDQGGPVNNTLRLARAIHSAVSKGGKLSYDVTAVGESHDPNKLTNKGKKGGGDASARPISGEDYEGVREDVKNIYQDAPDGETVTVTHPRFKRGPGPLDKARAIHKAITRKR